MTGNKHYIPYPVCCIETLRSSIMRASLVQGRMGGGKVPGSHCSMTSYFRILLVRNDDVHKHWDPQ